MKRYLVFGAAGSIGREVCSKLHQDGHFVIVCPKGITPTLQGSLMDSVWNVADRGEVQQYADLYDQRGKVDGVVYCVGHCPPGGFPDAIKDPLSLLALDKYLSEVNMHQVGVLNVFQCMLKHLNDEGCFVFLSSAITRLKGQFPSFLQAHYHAGVIAAEDWLIDGMRADPTVQTHKIKIHRLAPVAVDTPFHYRGPKPSKLIPISEVVNEVVTALGSQVEVDKQIL